MQQGARQTRFLFFGMTPTLHIRPMQLADLPAILDIQAVCYTTITPESEASLSAKLRASPRTCFIAEQNGKAVGYLISLPWDRHQPPELDARQCHPPAQPNCLYLHDLAVAPAARKSGAGRALTAAFFKALDTLQLPCASLIAIQGSGSYWSRYGFRPAPLTAQLKNILAKYGRDAGYMVCPA